MARLPLFWGANSDVDFSSEIHRADGSTQEPVTLCQACGLLPAQRTGLITGRACCAFCGQTEEDISVRQFAERWRRGVEHGERLLARRVG